MGIEQHYRQEAWSHYKSLLADPVIPDEDLRRGNWALAAFGVAGLICVAGYVYAEFFR